MPKPGLEFEQGHRFFGVEQLGDDGGSCSMAGDAAASILERHACFAAQEWNQRSIEVLRWNRLTAETEEHRNGLTGLSIEEVRLHWTLPLPCVHSVTDQRIDRLCEGRSGLIRRHVEQACGSVTGHMLGRSGWARIPSLPPDASDTQPHEFIAAESGKEPGQCQRPH